MFGRYLDQMTPDDIARYATVTDPQLHPDGQRVAFVVERANVDTDRYESEIRVWNGSASIRFTTGGTDDRPRWSPDGESLLFLRTPEGEGESAQLAVMPARGGEAEILTDFELGVREAEWAPDGRSVAVVATTWIPEWADLDDAERRRRPRRLSAPEWRFDGRGFLHDRRTSLYVIDLEGGASVAMAPDRWDPSSVSWHPDGTSIAFLAKGHDRAGFDGGNQAWRAPVGGDEPVALVGVGDWDVVSHDPDGVVHLIGVADLAARPANARLYRVGADGPVALASGLDRDVRSPGTGPQWLESGACLVMAEDRGRQVVVEVQRDGSHREVHGGRNCVTGLSATADGSTMAATITAVDDPGELVIIDGAGARSVTDVNASFRATAGLRCCEHTTVMSGGHELDVWVYLPEGDGPFPVLFNIHGGPATQYGWQFFDEFQVELGAGYAVVATNPRGASGHGEEFVRGAVGTWVDDQPADALDLLAALDGALDRFDQLDSNRVGIMGGSYGGLISARILSFDHRFRSAVPERGVYNFVSMAGASDIGLWFDGIYVGERDYTDWSALWDASPLRTAHLIRTPCLVIHSDADHRCPIDQVEQLFTTLLANGVEAEFLRVPDEGHELSRSGSPKHRVERFDAILDWHGRHLSA